MVVVVITGASSGIGAELAKQLAARGDKVVLVARREAELLAVAEACGDNALAVVGDVTKREDHLRVVDAALTKFGHVDVYVNNAGRGITKLPSLLTDEEFDEMMLVNVKSALYGAQAIIPHLKARGRGQIINVSSLLGRMPLAAFRSAYVAAKHALNGLTGALRGELTSQYPDLHVTLVSPGVVATEFGLNSVNGGFDSRAIPNAQSADAVAKVIVGAIDAPSADVYTFPAAHGMVAAYYAAEDMWAAEQKPPFFPFKP
jgi:short-subunit dehydrogenase